MVLRRSGNRERGGSGLGIYFAKIEQGNTKPPRGWRETAALVVRRWTRLISSSMSHPHKAPRFSLSLVYSFPTENSETRVRRLAPLPPTVAAVTGRTTPIAWPCLFSVFEANYCMEIDVWFVTRSLATVMRGLRWLAMFSYPGGGWCRAHHLHCGNLRRSELAGSS